MVLPKIYRFFSTTVSIDAASVREVKGDIFHIDQKRLGVNPISISYGSHFSVLRRGRGLSPSPKSASETRTNDPSPTTPR